ncbi:hypothetical protein BaRGS_00014527, partial [Batillaria attramentaria]
KLLAGWTAKRDSNPTHPVLALSLPLPSRHPPTSTNNSLKENVTVLGWRKTMVQSYLHTAP